MTLQRALGRALHAMPPTTTAILGGATSAAAVRCLAVSAPPLAASALRLERARVADTLHRFSAPSTVFALRALHTASERCTSAERPNPIDQKSAPATTLYTGALSATVVRVKVLSVASCFLTTAGAPIIIGLSRPDLSFSMQMATASSLACFGLFTTGLLQWFVSPYVLSIRARSPHLLEVERLNFLARRVVDVIDVRVDVSPPQTVKPLSTFMGKGRIYFFEREHWDVQADRHALLDAILVKAEPPEPEDGEGQASE